MIKNFFLLSFIVLLISCRSSEVGKVLRNEKVKNTDEFLVKQKQPLELPPDYDKIPIPNSKKTNKNNENQKIQSILNSKNKNISTKSNSSPVEESIIEKIRK